MPAVIRTWQRDQDNSDLLADITSVLDAGGLIVFPTETVYGVGGRWDLMTTEPRLRAAKGREEGKPFQLLVGGLAGLGRLRVDMPDLAHRFADVFWPGPLTLVVPTSSGEFIGLREPDHEVALAVLHCAGGSLTATSANRSGCPPARSAAEALQALGNAVDLAIDDGPARIGEASSVIRVTRQGWELLREGALSREELAEVGGLMVNDERGTRKDE
jgi:L-threonylcarbamoyladenylate synthase